MVQGSEWYCTIRHGTVDRPGSPVHILHIIYLLLICNLRFEIIAMACNRVFKMVNIDYSANFYQIYTQFSPLSSELHEFRHEYSYMTMRSLFLLKENKHHR